MCDAPEIRFRDAHGCRGELFSSHLLTHRDPAGRQPIAEGWRASGVTTISMNGYNGSDERTACKMS